MSVMGLNVRGPAITVVGLLVLLAGCGAGGASDESVLRMKLPKDLREISGLAVFEDQLLAIADERGRIYRISFQEEQVKRIGAFGDPVVKADFEGLAVVGQVIYGITSDGHLYSKAVAAADTQYQVVDTGLGAYCEIEGLASIESKLLAICKAPRIKDYRGQLVIFAWDVAQRARVADADLFVDLTNFGINKGDFNPSAIEVVEEGLLIIAARQQHWVLITPTGQFVRGGELPNKKSHRQTEGLAVYGGYSFLADEGNKRGTLTRYEGQL